MSRGNIEEDVFLSDEDFDDEEGSADSETSEDIDEKLAYEEVFDADFLKCYSALKRNDSKIYDKKVNFFNENQDVSESSDEENNAKDSSPKPRMTLLDHHLKVGELGIEEPSQIKVDLNKTVSKSFYEKELEEIKKNIEMVSKEVEDSEDDLLIVKARDTSAGSPKRGSKISSILDKMENEDVDEVEHLKNMWSNPKDLSYEDKFLRDYILNKRYLNKTDDGSEDEEQGVFFSKNLDQLSDVEEEDEPVKKSSKVDFHSQEQGADRIPRIPRNSTKTIRDIVERKAKKEKRLRQIEKEKKRKKSLEDADCEDIIDDLPTKFHYRETTPNDYGLTAEELLMATDEELESWVKLKDAIKYRTLEDEERLKRKYDRQRNDIELKKRIFTSIYGNSDGKDPSGEKQHDDESRVHELASDINRKKRKRKRGLNHKKFAKIGVAPDRLLAYGLSKNKLKKSKLM